MWELAMGSILKSYPDYAEEAEAPMDNLATTPED